jgi:hypothetical protein
MQQDYWKLRNSSTLKLVDEGLKKSPNKDINQANKYLGSTNVRVDECLGWWMFGSTNVWVDECSVRWMFGLMNVWVDECLVRWMFGSTNVQVDKCSGQQMFGSTSLWVNEFMGRQIFVVPIIDYISVQHLFVLQTSKMPTSKCEHL